MEKAGAGLQTEGWRYRLEVGRLPPVGGSGKEEADVAKMWGKLAKI